MELKVIGRIYNNYKTKFGIPRQSGLVKQSLSKIIFEKEYRDPNALRGLEDFSHLWILWYFSENDREKWSPTVRPPRLGGNKRMGVFATRSPFRPNPVGLSCVEIESIEYNTAEGPIIYVRGADLMDGTPIYDLKPYLPYVDAHPEAKAGFGGVVKEHQIEVEIPDMVRKDFIAQRDFDQPTEGTKEGTKEGQRKKMEDPEAFLQEVEEILAQDPKPGYQRDEERIYGMEYGDYEIKFCYRNGKIEVIAIQ